MTEDPTADATMASFVTSATGLVGRRLVEELLARRPGPVHVLVRPADQRGLRAASRQWGPAGDRVVVVDGDLADAALGVDPDWVRAHRGTVTHFFHLPGAHDTDAAPEDVDALVVGGTRNALELAADLDARCFHHLSAIGVSGDHPGLWEETMLDEGQRLPTPYQRATLAAERAVREESAVPWRVYRPSLVVGDSRTGAMAGVEGPTAVFPALKVLRDLLPSWAPLVGVDVGDTNLVPVDYVARAVDHLAHLADRDGETFHLVATEPMRTVDVLNAFARAAGAPRFATPVDRDALSGLPAHWLPRGLRPSALARTALRTPPTRAAVRETLGRLGLGPEALEQMVLPGRYGAQATERALGGSGITVPPLESYAARLWDFWEERLDDAVAHDRRAVAALRGRTVVLTRAAGGVGRATAFRVARAGGVPVLVDRDEEALDDAAAAVTDVGGDPRVFVCDLGDPDDVDRLARRLTTELRSVDLLVNDAAWRVDGADDDGPGDLERSMRQGLFAAVRLTTGLLPAMRAQRSGHVVNVTPDGLWRVPARPGPEVASGAALDAWTAAVRSEAAADGVTLTTLHLPRARTPVDDAAGPGAARFRVTPARAADLVVRALVDRPGVVGPVAGRALSAADALDRVARALRG